MQKMVGAADLILAFQFIISSTNAHYWKEREDFIKLEESQMLGYSMALNSKELSVNEILMSLKLAEYDVGFENPDAFAPAKHFFHSKKDVEVSKVFQFIKKMPKGGALHSHDTALASEEYLYNLTFSSDLYACTVNGRLKLKFLINSEQDKMCNWTLISVLRGQDPAYDKWVRSQLSLVVDNPTERYANINEVWRVFEEVFETIDPMLYHRPVYDKYFYQGLKELYDDNVMYLEVRGSFPKLYELDGSTSTPMETAIFTKATVDRFKEDHPDFLGVRYIYSPARKVDNQTVHSYLELAKDFKGIYPDFFAGFDLIGQENLGLPLVDFISHLKEMSSNGINFFFHAGETGWYGSSTDFNLVDAVLLGTKRIGHAYALTKHPLVMELVKRNDIGVEVCPISNQVLMLVEDMRNHPAASLIAQGFPVIISNDDPSFWSAKGLSYDLYMAFMGIASRNADLKLLKQLAVNSLTYSALSEVEKEAAVKAWEGKWDEFLDQILEDNQ